MTGSGRKWQLFSGAFLSVVLGVALVQSSLLLLISAAVARPPAGYSAAEAMTFSDNMEAVVAMLGIVLGIATFLAGFVISSTFAFTVAQRRRDLALLRLVGASRGQVGRMMLGEATLLGLLGAAVGVPSGLVMMATQEWLMRRMGFVPDGFHGQWREWILAVSFGLGIVLAVAGSMVAAHRAGRVHPLEALRDTGDAARVMTWTRWLFGVIFLGGALALIIVAPHGGPGGGPAMAMNVPLAAAVGVAALSPIFVPMLGRLMPGGALARANLWDGRRRSASIAAPLIVLVALVVGTSGAGATFTASGISQEKRETRADLVVDGTGPLGAKILAVPGVLSASTELSIPATVTTGSGDDKDTETVSALAIDPTSYAAVHSSAGSLEALHGRAVAGGPGGEISAGGTVEVSLPSGSLGSVPVVAAAPATMSGGADLLLPPGLVPAPVLASAPARSFVTLAPGASPASVRAALSRIGTVTDLDAWLKADAADRQSTSNKIMVVIIGLGGLYALIGVVNSVVIGAAARRREFATARVTGMTRGQVVRSALLESSAVTVAGLLLGGVAAAGALLAAATSTSAITGHASFVVPLGLTLGVCALALLVTGATSVLTSWSATRRPPVALLGARE
jgi:putative ABC transport system permease protein